LISSSTTTSTTTTTTTYIDTNTKGYLAVNAVLGVDLKLHRFGRFVLYVLVDARGAEACLRTVENGQVASNRYLIKRKET